MGGAPVFKEDNMPAPPMGADHPQEGLMGFLHPCVGNQQQHLPAPDIEDAMQHAAGMIASHRDADPFADPPVATVEGRGLQNDRLIKHQADRPFPLPQPVLKPPFACCQVGERRAKVCRGRFQRTRSRASAKLTL